jgi:ribosomal protein L37AE/L43A
MKVVNGIFKWFAVLAFSLSAGLLVIIFLSDQPQINTFLLRILILLAVGFTGGLFMRSFFGKGFAVVLILIGLITNVLAVLIIDHFYETEYLLSFVTKDFVFQIPSTGDAAQISLLFLISLPAILIFRRKKKPRISEKIPRQPRRTLSDRIKPIMYQVNPTNWNIKLPTMQTFTDWIKPITYQVNPANWNIELPKIVKKQPKSAAVKKSTKSKTTAARSMNKTKVSASKSVKKTAASRSGTKSKSSTVHVSAPSSKSTIKRTSLKSTTRKKPLTKKIKLPGIRAFHTNNDVKLTGEEEHVCPYCLEEVVRNDSQGVVVCQECGTWHHQDCWDVTGACGVAHRNEL